MSNDASDVISHQAVGRIHGCTSVDTMSPYPLSNNRIEAINNLSALASLVSNRISHSEHPSPFRQGKWWQEEGFDLTLAGKKAEACGKSSGGTQDRIAA